jgi:hypothetical protein
MRTPRRANRQNATTATTTDLALPRGRHPLPTGTRLHTRRIPVAMYLMALLVIPGIVVAGFMSAGLWATTSSRNLTAQAGTQAGTQTGTQKGTGEGSTGAGTPAVPAPPADPADVRGSMTVQQVVEAFPPITANQILTKLGAPMDTPTSTQLKNLAESGNGTDIPALRTWLQEQIKR